ncbi:MAG TPA: AAA family ATPase, partial [Candidatus Tectomicrobia bacterium]
QRVVARQELFEQVWSAQFVSDAALESCVKAVRQAIGDTDPAQRMIQTVHGYGYRFAAAVEVRPPALPDAATVMQPAPDHTAVALPPAAPLFLGERKPATVLCCALADALALHERLGLDALHSLMREVYELAQDEVQQYGGTMQHVAGDRFLAIFGVPVAQEDHARRAVLAALGLHQQVEVRRGTLRAPLGKSLLVRMGLHTGLVAVGGLGKAEALAAAVVGDTTVLATALQEMAAPGTMLCSDTTARLVQGTARLEVVQPVHVPGVPQPLGVYKLLGVNRQRRPVIQHGTRALSRFVGRQRELAALQALLVQVEEGRGQVVGIVGAPGMGKSRLIYEFRRSLANRRCTYLAGPCLSYGSHTPYLPLLDIVRHHCGITDADGPETLTAKVAWRLQTVGMVPEEWAPYVCQLFGVQVGTERLAALRPQALKTRTFTALVQMLINGSRQQPLLIEIEDLHWIDPTSEEFLLLLVQQLAGAPLLLLTTYRPGYRPAWMDKSYATQLALQRLTPADSRRIVRTILDSEQASGAMVQTIVAKADGNPFFLEELARAMAEHQGQQPHIVVPDTVQAVLMARLDRLAPMEKRLLQTAAVIGKDVPLSVLRAVADLSEEVLLSTLQRLQEAEFLYETAPFPEPAYTFTHALTQEVAYQSLLHRTRQEVHARIAQVLTAHFPERVASQPELVAQHYTEAGQARTATGYWLQAGRKATERSANVEASAHLTRGLDLLKTLPDTPECLRHELALQTALGPVLMALKGQAAEEVGGAYRRAHELCQQTGETRQLFPVLWGLWHFHAVREELPQARTLGEQLLRDCVGGGAAGPLLSLTGRAQDPTPLLGAHFMLGGSCLFAGEFTLAHTHFEHSMALYNPRQHNSQAFLLGPDPGVFCTAFDAHALWHLGYPDRARTSMAQGLAQAQTLAHPFSIALALDYAAMLYQFCQDPLSTQERAATAIALCTEQGFAYYRAWGTIMRGWALTMQGQGEAGLTDMRQGLEALRATGASLRLPYYLALLAEAYGKVGQTEAGQMLLAEALALVPKTGEHWREAELYRLQGELLLHAAGGVRHAAVVAEERFQQALDLARHQHARSLELRAAMSLARLWQQQGQRAAARHLLAEVYGWFTEGFATTDLQEARALLEALA